MPKTVDPVFSSSVLAAADLATALDIDALTQSLAGLEGKVDKNPKTAAIILAGGTGERFGKEGGKQLVEIGGKPILTWSVEAFDAVGDIGLIVIVVWVGFQRLRAGARRTVLGIVAAIVVGVKAWLATPATQ